MTRRDLQRNVLLRPALVLAVAALALALGSRHYARLDLTADGTYSLEPVTERLLADLAAPLTIRVYFTHDLEPPYHQLEGVVRDVVDEYRARNPGQVRVEWVDPTHDPALQSTARGLGVEPVTLFVSAEGRREERQVWMGIAFLFQDRVEAYPAILGLDDLEYQMTRRIRSVVEDRSRPVVGYVVGHGEPDLGADDRAMAPIREKIEENYELRRVTFEDGVALDQQLDLLLVIGPREPWTEPERYALDQYLMSGRPAAVWRCQLRPNPRTRQIRVSGDHLGDLLDHYGLHVEPTFLADRYTNGQLPVAVSQGGRPGTGYVNHALVPLATDFDHGHPVGRGMEALELPLSSPLTVIPGAPGCPECQVHEIAYTADTAVALPEVASLDRNDYVRPVPGEQPGPFLAVAAVEGSLRSFYDGASAPDGSEWNPRSPEGTRLLVVGSADYALKDLGFLLGVLDWMAADEDLLSLRPDLSMPAVLRPVGRGEGHLLRLVNLAGVPLVIAAIAVIRARRRRGDR